MNPLDYLRNNNVFSGYQASEFLMPDGGQLIDLMFADSLEIDRAWYFLAQRWACQIVFVPSFNTQKILVALK